MRKTMEQIVLEGQTAKCESLEELYLLWQMMQQMEEEPYGATCYSDIDQRSFHIDGIVSPEEFSGNLYILKETNMRKYIQKGQTMPVISDIRRQVAAAKSATGEVEYLDYLAGMQKILNEEKEHGGAKLSMQKLLKQLAVVYVNKRGGKGAADDISMQYGQYYIEFLKRQIKLLKPKTIVCCSDEIFRLVVMEVFQNKKQKKNQEIYMKWKNLVIGDVFYADSQFKPTADEKHAAVRVIRMWNPAYRVNNGQYVSLEEYLKEFERRVKNDQNSEKNL
ncbi:MAG: hypothetical protein IJ374_01535 [Lachnospiraceae bacterium]|nr:hypothetical protein [Lachnospiraceae bacterium]